MAVDRCPTCGRKARRSSDQNRHYWMLIFAIADKLKPKGEQYSAETWHTYLKTRFLGADDVTLPNKKTLLIPKSTADLDKHEFAEYVTQVEAWCAEHDVYLDELESK